MNEDLIAKVGLAIWGIPEVQTTIHSLATKTISAIITIISPYIIPVLTALGIVIAAVAIGYLTCKVAEWIMKKQLS